MNTLMGMGIFGWLLALLVGFIIGGLFFVSIRLQVEYVLKEQRRLWLVPACMFARLALVAVVLVLVAVLLPREKVAAAMLSGMIGVFLARIAVSRSVRRPDNAESKNAEEQ